VSSHLTRKNREREVREHHQVNIVSGFAASENFDENSESRGRGKELDRHQNYSERESRLLRVEAA
jgi:hypothetical protein